MTQQNMVVDGGNGRVVIYSGPQDDDIEADPFHDLSKVSFHSDLDYIGFTKITTTYTIPATSGSVFRMERINLGAHGKAFTPICFAVLKGWNNGNGNPVDLPLAGGVLLDFYGERPDDTGDLSYTGTANDRWSRITTVFQRFTRLNNSWEQKSLLVGAGADGSNLFLWYEQAALPVGGDGSSYPALALTIDFYVGDRSIDGSSGDTAPSNLFDSDETSVVMSTTRLTASGTTGGGFDSDRYYFHADASDPLFPVVTTNAVEFSIKGTAPNQYFRDAIYYGPDWSFDLVAKYGTISVPSAHVPSTIGLSF